MNRDRAIRMGLSLSVLPSAMAIAVSAIFAGAFAWLVRQAVINRAPVAVGGFAKLGDFVATAAYWLAGDLPAAMVGNTVVPDFLPGDGFVLWAATERPQRATG